MAEPRLLPSRNRDSDIVPGPLAPALSRLNAIGFRLVHAADVGVLLVVLVGAMVFQHGWLPWPDYPAWQYAVSFGITLLVFLAALYFGGLYERQPRLGYPPALPTALRQTVAAGGLIALANLALTGVAQELGYAGGRLLPMPTPVLVTLIVLGAVVVSANRWLAKAVRTAREGPPRVLLVGGADDVEVARDHLHEDRERARVVGQVTSTAGLVGAVDDLQVTDVVLLSGRWLDSLYPDVLTALEQRGVTVLQRVTAKETMFGLERVRQIGGLPFVLLRSQTMQRSRARFKRFTELTILLVSAPALLPLLAVVTLYQLVVAGRPLLFWQTRVGARGRHFEMVKFRTMQEDAEEDGGPQLASREDPRIIPACRWIRAMRLDELPQLYNVLRGEMALVGPRPERPELTARFERIIPGYARRHEVPPGLTGMAQIHGRYHTDPEYKLGYDLQYLVNWSPVLDVEILLRTLWVVLARRI